MATSRPASATPSVVVVMGVAGSGKSTIASMLAERLGWTYVDADWLHPPSNVAKMRGGTPLTDEDRWPWLDAVAKRIDALNAAGEGAVVACSALKRAYRRVLLGSRGGRVVYLEGDPATVAQRLGTRDGHFMPAALLESQFATLEPPQRDEEPITVSIALAPARIVEAIVGSL